MGRLVQIYFFRRFVFLKCQIQEHPPPLGRLQTLCGVSKTQRTGEDAHNVFEFSFHTLLYFKDILTFVETSFVSITV